MTFAMLMALALSSATPAGAVASEVEAPGPNGALRGTSLDLAEPQGAPVAIIIPGSGPTDRDGNSPVGIRASSYRLLAEALAARGVATVRVDKRGMFGSAAAGPANGATISGYAQDMQAWVAATRARTGARCVWLIGHSEGGLVALATARTSAEGICGVVLVASLGRRLSDVMREQVRALPEAQGAVEQAMAAFDRLDAGETVDVSGLPAVLQQIFAPQVQPYLIDTFRHDPAAIARDLRLPILVLHGQSDLQVTEVDARRLASANARARLVQLPGVNHVLKVAPADDRAANIATYFNPDLPLAPGVAEAVAGFLRQ